MSWIVVRVRSNVNVERSIRETMDYLNLTKVNHAVIIPENDQYRGMLQKAKDYITWGEATEATVEKMLAERGRMSGDSPLTDDIVKDSTDFKNISDFAKSVTSGDSKVKDVPGLKRVFRLHPPRGPKGWGGIKRSFVIGGALGARGDEINSLVDRVIKDKIEEVILATSATVEGQTTAFYVQNSLKETKTKVTRLAQGLPVGGEIETLDDGTLFSAFKNRSEINSS